jgi:hypothetical protein
MDNPLARSRPKSNPISEQLLQPSNRNSLEIGNQISLEMPVEQTLESPKKSVRFTAQAASETPENTASAAENAVDPSAGSTFSSPEVRAGQEELTFEWDKDQNLDHLLVRGEEPFKRILSADSRDAGDSPRASSRTASGTMRKKSSLRMSSTEALQIGLLLSEQERKYGTNMYESLQIGDETLIDEYVRTGLTTEEAILKIFESRFIHKVEPPRPAPPSPPPHTNPMGQNADTIADEENENDFKRSPLFPTLSQRNMSSSQQIQTTETTVSTASLKMSANEALQIGLLLSQQEQEFGTNMYESLVQEDEDELVILMQKGMSSHDAALEIFKRKFVYKINVDSENNARTVPAPATVSFLFNFLIFVSKLIVFCACHIVGCFTHKTWI